MKDTTRKTRSTTRSRKSQCLEIFIKQEEDMKNAHASLKQQEHFATSSLDLNVKVEEKATNVKNRLARFAKENGQ